MMTNIVQINCRNVQHKLLDIFCLLHFYRCLFALEFDSYNWQKIMIDLRIDVTNQ